MRLAPTQIPMRRIDKPQRGRTTKIIVIPTEASPRHFFAFASARTRGLAQWRDLGETVLYKRHQRQEGKTNASTTNFVYADLLLPLTSNTWLCCRSKN